jgi:carbon monoxide dehydrogenase subunit G
MTIDSDKVTVNATSEEIFNFLADAKNINELLPQDNIKDFESTATSCSFKVQGGITITLEQKELIPFSAIKMKSGEKSPFPFDLTIHISEQGAGSEGYIAFEGDVNPFLKMMVQKPLTNLFNYMSKRMQDKYAGQ